MVSDLIIKNLDLWTSALLHKSSVGNSNGTLETYGVKKLRDLILELAMRGQLVPQDPDDEPASVVLKNITKEKVLLAQEGGLPRTEPLSPVREDEKRFNLPTGWEWIRFGNIFELEYGNNLPEAKRTNTGEYPVYGSNGVVGTHDSYCVDSPCIVVGRKGSAGALNLSLSDKCWVTDVAYSVIPPTGLDLKFLFKLFHSLGLEALGKGIKPGLNRNEVYALPVAIPPFAEQHRIAAKVDELMALCDQLEQQQTQSMEAHQTLVETLLGTLTRVASHQELSEAWIRIASHFDAVFTTEHSIDQLKQTILQLAITGELVRQDHTERPPTVLLKAIAAEKAVLVDEGKIREVPSPTARRAPFSIPDGWVWSELADLVALVTDGDHQAPPQSAEGIPFLVIGNLNTGVIDFGGCKFVQTEYYDKLDWGRKPLAGDLLYTVTGSFGIPVLVDTEKPFCVQRHVAILKATHSTPRQYLALVLASQFAVEYATAIATGIAQKTVPITGLRRMPIPVPSEEEQHRIVAKVDELMALCDALKARLADAQMTQVHLADAIVEQAVA